MHDGLIVTGLAAAVLLAAFLIGELRAHRANRAATREHP